MAPTVIRVMSVAGKSRDSTAALNPRLDAEKSGMVSTFKPGVPSECSEATIYTQKLYPDVVAYHCLVRKPSPYIPCASVGRPRFVRRLPIPHRWPAEFRIKDGWGVLTIGPRSVYVLCMMNNTLTQAPLTLDPNLRFGFSVI